MNVILIKFRFKVPTQLEIILLTILGFLLAPNTALAFRVYPTIAQNEAMLDKSNFPFIAENADGFNLPYDGFGPFSAGQVEKLFNQFSNKNFINHGVYKENVPITSMSTMNKKPSFANVTAMMLYNEAPAMDSAEWASALAQDVPWPLITHCRAFGHTSIFNELKRQIQITSGCMFEFQVTNKGKYDDALELTKYCVDNDRTVVFLTTFQKTPDIFIAAYKEFFYYLKENLDPEYLNSDHVIFIPNTYNDREVLPETKGYGSTFGVAHWLIDQKSKVNDGYIQPKVNFIDLDNDDFFPNHSDLTVAVNVDSQQEIAKVELFVNGVSAGEINEAPYTWSGGILDDLTTGSKNLKAVVTDVNGNTTFAAIQIKILKDPPVVPGFFKAGDLFDFNLRSAPLDNGEIRHVYGKEWIDYKLNVKHTGMYDLRVDLGVQRSKQYGGTIIIKKGDTELGSFTTVLNDPDKPALSGFTEHPEVLIKDIALEVGVQVLRVTFEHPEGRIVPQFRLNDFNFSIHGAPEINFTIPERNQAGAFNEYNAPANIVVGADISSPRTDGVVKTAELFVNGKSAGKITAAPFVWNDSGDISELNNLPGGIYNIKIVATDELGYTAFKEISLKVVDRQPYNANLKIPGVVKAIEYDLGGEGVAYHDFNEGVERGLGGADNPRYARAGNEDVEIERSAGDFCVSAIRNGEWLNYTIADVQKGTYEIILTTASNAGKSADVVVWLNGEVIATVPISQTATVGFTQFKDFSVANIEIPEDLKNATIRLEFVNPAIRNYLCFFRKFEFRKQEDIGIPSIGFVRPAADTVLMVDYSAFNVIAQASVGTNFSINSVSLFLDDVLVEEDYDFPYSWEGGVLLGLSPGIHTLKVVTKSSAGLTASDIQYVMVWDPMQVPQIVSIQPPNQTTVDGSGSLIVSAEVLDPDNDLASVALWLNGNPMGYLAQPPFKWGEIEKYVHEGANELKIRAEDQKGHYVDSTWVVNVSNAQSPISLVLLKPTGVDEIQVESGYQLDVEVAAESSVGEIIQVTLFIDGKEIRTERVAPYTWGHAGSPDPNELNDLGIGTHELKFVAVDDKGNQNELIISLLVEVATHIHQNEVANFVSVYPNPAKTQFTIHLYEDMEADIYLYNLLGSLLMKETVVGSTTIYCDNKLPSGTYLLSIHTSKYGWVTKKLVLK